VKGNGLVRSEFNRVQARGNANSSRLNHVARCGELVRHQCACRIGSEDLAMSTT